MDDMTNSQKDTYAPYAFDKAAAEINLRWATERLKVVEGQRAMDLESIARLEAYLDSANRMIDEKILCIADRDVTIHRLRSELAKAGLALDELTKGES